MQMAYNLFPEINDIAFISAAAEKDVSANIYQATDKILKNP